MKNPEEPKQPIGHGEKYSRKKEEAIVRLLESPTVKEAAKRAGISEKTLHRWLQYSEFRTAYEEEKKRTFAPTKEALAEAGPRAVSQLQNIMLDVGKDRVGAAKCLLDTICKMIKLVGDTQAAESEPETKEEKAAAPAEEEQPHPEETADGPADEGEQEPSIVQTSPLPAEEETTGEEDRDLRERRLLREQVMRERYSVPPRG